MSEQSPAVSNREEGDPPATAVATASGEPEQGAFQSTADNDEQSSARPTDEQILAHEYNVRVEEAKKVELIGSLEPLSSLAAEYRQGSQVVVAKIERLERQYRSLRRARGDGNCFFRSAIFSYLEGLICANDVEERDRVVECLGGWESKMEEAGFQKLVFEDALTLLTELVQSIGSVVDPLPLEVLELKMRSEEVSNYIVMFVRFLTSASIRRSQEFFAPFILGLSDLDVDDFCRTQVEPMGEESDHVQIVALSQALQLPIRVVYLDNSGSLAALQASSDPAAAAAAASGTNSPEATYHDFLPDGFSGSPRVHLLYRPGHYDILYPR